MTSDCSEVSRHGNEMSNASPVAERPSVVWSPVSSPNTPDIERFSENCLMFSKQIKFSTEVQSIIWRFVCSMQLKYLLTPKDLKLTDWNSELSGSTWIRNWIKSSDFFWRWNWSYHWLRQEPPFLVRFLEGSTVACSPKAATLWAQAENPGTLHKI